MPAAGGRMSRKSIAMRSQSEDTDPQAELKQIELLRSASVARRTAIAFSLSETVIGLARRAIQRANPQLSPQDALVRFVAIHYGPELAERLHQDLKQRSQ
jgi:hypothetical protein